MVLNYQASLDAMPQLRALSFGRSCAITVCPWLILVVRERRGDVALIAHEEVHARQQRATGWFA